MQEKRLVIIIINMNEQTTYKCNTCRKEVNESSFSYRRESCDACTDKTEHIVQIDTGSIFDIVVHPTINNIWHIVQLNTGSILHV